MVIKIYDVYMYEFFHFVLDATADRNNPEDSIICMRFLSSFSYRMPNESVSVLEDFYKFSDASANNTYKMYKNNLNEGDF